jgi:hypothetical protein
MFHFGWFLLLLSILCGIVHHRQLMGTHTSYIAQKGFTRWLYYS